MNDQDFEEKCRICLKGNVDVHWNNVLHDYSDLTYRDCYYKCTQLEYFDEDNFPTMLCPNCSNGLEFINAFVTKAIESHVILQEKFRVNMMKKDGDNIKHEETKFETILMEETEIKPETQENPICEVSSEEFPMIPAENKACFRLESCTVSLKKTRKNQKSKLKIRDESLLEDKIPFKKIEQSICCSICSKVLSSKYKAIIHEKTHIKNRERNETCVECGLKFYSREILKAHMLTHLENREKAHKCEFCDKAFYNKGGLNIHRRIHLGQMISCSLCTKKFYREFDLDKHMASHSAARINSNVKISTKCFVRCKDCGKNIRSTSFKSHTAKHMNEPLFKCSICNKEFFHRDSCVKHLKKYHKKANEDIINFIVSYKKNRISHLFLQQNTNVQVKYE